MFRGFQTFGAAMSSISATSNSNYLTPQQLLQAELQQEISSGAISSSDQSALSSALNDINSSLQGGSSPAATGNASSAGDTSPADIQSKISGLIANEVSSGKLTQQQATELQGVFQNAFAGGASGTTGSSGVQGVTALSAAGGAGGPGAGGSGGVHHGHGGHGGHGGGSSATSASNSDSSSTSSADQILQQFLQSLQSSTSSASTYTASGSAAPVADSNSSAASLLVNYRT
jgi:hypothetical protein